MLDTLLHIPHQIAGLPVFGFGWALAIWTMVSLALLGWLKFRGAVSAEIFGNVPVLLIIAAVIIWVLPRVEEVGPGQVRLGLPIRGFGTMVMVGAVLGIALGMRRTRQMGGDPELVSSLAFVVCVAGFVGARAFYVIQYFDDFRRPTTLATIQQIMNFTEGGMVIYGSILGGFVAGILYGVRHQMPILPYCDLLAPSLAIGMAVGRLGCFCHGCCFAGVTEPGICTVQFPQGSPAYWHQFRRGQLHGIRLGKNAQNEPIVVEVAANSAAEKAGVRAGVVIAAVHRRPVESLDDALLDPATDLIREFSLTSADGVEYRWDLAELPDRSMSVQPVQLYSFVSSLLMFGVLWFYYPLRVRDGEVLGLLMAMYPIARTLEEIIRDDESGKFGTALTISQWISVLTFVGAGVFWAWLLRQPKGIRSLVAPRKGTFST